MQYLMLIVTDEEAESTASPAERDAVYGRIVAWWNEHAAAGRILDGHELQPSSTATTVRIGPDRTTTVTDGPYLEAKETIGGYGLLDVADLDEALALAASWPGASTTLEIRPIAVRG